MAPANPVPQNSSADSPGSREPFRSQPDPEPQDAPEPVSQQELNAWRRGLTPQAEIWNGRLAMLGLSMGLLVLLLARLAGRHS